MSLSAESADGRGLEGTIAVVLGRHLPADVVAPALDIWLSSFSTRGLGGMVAYLNDIDHLARLDQKSKHSLRMDLYSTLYGNGQTPASAPRSQPQPPTQPTASTANAGVAGEVFVALGQRLVEGAQRAGFAEYGYFCEALEEQLADTKLASSAKKNLLDWALHRARIDISKVPETQLRTLVNAFYIALCEALGPSASDIVLAQALADTRSLPAARVYPPERLL